jgi:hypothetical protein
MTSHQLGWDDTLVYALNAHRPDYALALPGTAWDIVTAQWWFQEAYQPVEQFGEATLFGRKPTNPQPLIIDAANRFERGLVLDELTLSTAELEPGQNLTASLAISVTQPAPPLRFTTYLIDSRLTNRYEVTDTDPFANLYPSQNWQPGDYLRLPLRLAVPDDLPWGAYQFGIVLFDTAAGTPLKQANQSTEIHLGYLRNGRPDSTLNPDLTPMPINQEWANGIRLQETALPERAAPGESIPVQLLWNTSALPEKDWTYFIHLVNDQEEIVAQFDQRPLNGRWPTPAWRPEEPFWESVMLSIPPDLPAGSYHLRLGFYILDERLPLMASGADFLWLPAVIEIGA